MANPEHLKILEQGVDVWNRWREENPSVLPDLSHANCQRAVLLGGHFENSNFRNANLQESILRSAYFQDANFEGANLRGVHLGAALILGRRSLARTDLTGAKFGNTGVIGIDLTCVDSIDEIIHKAPSHVDTTTIDWTAEGVAERPSKQAAIERFFRGAGLSEHHIESFRALVGRPIQPYSCFISYSHIDKSLARRLHDQLQARGIRCWLDEHDLNPGDRILDVVNDAIRLHDKILLCCSEASLNSWWVKDEIRKAMERERSDRRDIIIPLMVDRYLLDGWEDGLAADLRSRLAADFTGWEHDNAKFEEQFEKVVKALRADESPHRASHSKL